MGQPRPLFDLFTSFKHITICATNRYVKKCPSSIWCKDTNSRPLKHESPPIATRPGLSPKVCLWHLILNSMEWCFWIHVSIEKFIWYLVPLTGYQHVMTFWKEQTITRGNNAVDVTKDELVYSHPFFALLITQMSISLRL